MIYKFNDKRWQY